MTWYEQAAAIIAQVHAGLPVDCPLTDRMKAVDEARPWEFMVGSWPKKAWQKARRDYLRKYGYRSRAKTRPHETPLERAARRSREAMENR